MAKDAGDLRTPRDQMSRSAPPAQSDKKRISLLRLLGAFLKIGSIGFGGGMTVSPADELRQESLARLQTVLPFSARA